MKNGMLILGVILGTSSLKTKEHYTPVEVRVVDPEAISPLELDIHKKIASEAFFTYDTSINFAGPLQSYYDYFNTFFTAFKKQENEEFVVSAYDLNRQLIGGMFGKVMKYPDPVLQVKTKGPVYYIDCIYVKPSHEKKGIATKMLKKFLSERKEEDFSIFLYVWAINISARTVYEKCGFTLISDKEHPDGKGTAAAYALQTSKGYDPQDFVVYRYR